MNQNTFRLRPAAREDEDFLWQILYEAIYVGPGEEPPPPSVLAEAAIAQYLNGWGRAHDHGWIAEDAVSGKAIGAAWLRLWQGDERGYGYYHPDYPELTIALLPEARGQGVGTALLEQLIAQARPLYPGISLSVSRSNPARRLYERMGFRTVQEDDHSLVMVLAFSPAM